MRRARVLPCGRLPPGSRTSRGYGVTTNLPDSFPPVWKGAVDRVWRSRPPNTTAREAWADVLDRAREELPETTVVMWFADVRPLALAGDVLTLAVPSPLVRERLQHNHLALIEEPRRVAAGRPLKVDLAVDEALRDRPGLESVGPEPIPEPGPAARTASRAPRPASSPSAAQPSLGAPGLPFPNYTFDAFVPGPEQPLRTRGSDGRGRGAAVDRVQPAVHLRRGRVWARRTC